MNDEQQERKLRLAIERNDIGTANALILSGVNTVNGSPAIIHAAAHDRKAIMAMLLDAGTDVNATNEYRHNACCSAIYQDHFDAVKFLVERGADLRSPALLETATCTANEKIILFLLDAGASVENLTGECLINLVTRSKSVAVLRRLLARQIDVGALRDNAGNTICESISNFADPDYDLEELLRTLLTVVNDPGDFTKAFQIAVRRSNLSAVRIFAELGADIDVQSESGVNAVGAISGCWRQNGGLVEALLALGVDVRVADKEGRTACHLAMHQRHGFTVSLLLAAGSELDQPDHEGMSPRMIASRGNFALPIAADIEASRKRIARRRLDFVRHRAFEICVGLQPLKINALQLCEILMCSFGALGSLIAFHQWWRIVTKVKHFRNRVQL